MRPNRARMGDALLEMLMHLHCTGNWMIELSVIKCVVPCAVLVLVLEVDVLLTSPLLVHVDK